MPDKFLPQLSVGQTISNEDLGHIFEVGNMGGMRKSNKNNLLVIVSDHTKSLYDDRWVGDTLHYTGMGPEGNQDIDYAQNKTLSRSQELRVDVHLFEVLVPGEYVYLGEAYLAEPPYQESQIDRIGNDRLVWIFPVKLKSGNAPIVRWDVLESLEKQKTSLVSKISNEELLVRAQAVKTKVSARDTLRKQFDRNVIITEFAKRRANGLCELCENPAPFKSKDGNPFLEVHHVVWLAKGGQDTIENTVALCPNCHRKMHALDLESDRKRLIRKAGNKIL